MSVSPFASARRAPTRWWRRSLAFLAAAAIVVVVVWGLSIGALWVYSWWQLGGLDLSATDEETVPLGSVGAAAPDGTTTTLVVLTEPRDPTIPDEPELAAPVAIVQTGGARAQPAVLLLPTALPVTVEGMGTVSLDEVHREGGEELVAQAVVDYGEVRIDHLVSFTTDALPRLVEVLDDPRSCTTATCTATSVQEVRDAQTQADPEALVDLLGNTLRGLGASIDAATAIRSPLTAKRVIDVLSQEVRTDVSLRGTAVLDVAGPLADVGALDVEAIPMFRNPNTGSLVPLEEPVMVRFQRLRDGTSLDVDGEEDSVEELVTATVEVAVLNGAGTAGLAGDVRARLETTGFHVVGTGNAATFGHATTVVAYGPEPATTEAAAVVLAEQLDGAELQALEQAPVFEGDPVDVVVTVGEDLDTENG